MIVVDSLANVLISMHKKSDAEGKKKIEAILADLKERLREQIERAEK